jgi:hypothetical protein
MQILCAAVPISVKYSIEDLINNFFFKNRYNLDVEILSSLTVRRRIDYKKDNYIRILYRISQTNRCR